MEFIDYYKLLELDQSATAKDIKKPIENWRGSTILISIQTIKKPRHVFSRSMKLTKF